MDPQVTSMVEPESVPLLSHSSFHGELVRVGNGGDTVKVHLDTPGFSKHNNVPGNLSEQPWTLVTGERLQNLAYRAVKEVSHFLRPAHLASLRHILDDPEASPNDRFVAHDLLSNAVISSREVLPMCQDTGTLIIHARRGHRILTDGEDKTWLSRGIKQAFEELNLRYSQLYPLSTFEEANTNTNLPAQIHIETAPGAEYEFLIMAKGGGSANKSFLYQANRSVLEQDRMLDFIEEKIADIGTSACPPYHLAVVIGGTSAEECLQTAKLASAHHLDHLPTKPSALSWSLRDPDLEQRILTMTQRSGIGAQFGGKYFCHDVRVIRMPRHNGSLPIAIAVSCSADRQLEARIDGTGTWIEALDHEPERYLPRTSTTTKDFDSNEPRSQVRCIDLNQPMSQILAELAECDLGQRVSLSGTLVVARDLVHAELRRMIEAGSELPDWIKDHPVYYAGPSRTPREGRYATGSFGPTTAGRMDSYMDLLQSHGGALVSLAKGNRSTEVAEACGRHGGFYLGAIGGPAARLAEDCIIDSRVIGFEDFGMEAARAITVIDMPAFVVINHHGEDFYRQISTGQQAFGPSIPFRDTNAQA